MAEGLSIPAWRLALLGGAVLQGSNEEHRLDRKLAGLLAYLALEGEQARTRVAGLLWPEVAEDRARANLRQALYRLKKLVGAELVTNFNQAGERLALNRALAVDTSELEAHAFLGDDAPLLDIRGELLAHLDFDDSPEFAEWLDIQREHWLNLRVAAFKRVLEEPQHPNALRWAHRWIELDPLSEEAYAAQARVHLARGDRGAALKTLNHLEDLLRTELHVGPSLETQQLRAEVEQRAGAHQPVRGAEPSAALVSAGLVGREDIWAEMERRWAACQCVVLHGPPGQGKTRLMLDFLGARTRYDLLQGRPGDSEVQMSVLARYLRGVLPHVQADLQPWVLPELSRILPELSAVAPPAMTSETDKLRLFEAVYTVVKARMQQGVETLVIDDLHAVDTSSFEAILYVKSQGMPEGLRSGMCYRSGELSPRTAELIGLGVQRQVLTEMAVSPLNACQTAALLSSMQLEAPAALVETLHASTGGNPMFTLETVRNLLEQGRWPDGSEPLSLPPLVKEVTAQRLERRSPQAKRLAQVAAIAGVDFSVELAAKVLTVPPLDLLPALQELEDAQIMQGERFQHDLLLEAVQAGIHYSIGHFLHRCCAELLEGKAHPARVAEHWLAGGEPEKAVPWLRKAAELYEKTFDIRSASSALRTAGAILEDVDDKRGAFDIYYALFNLIYLIEDDRNTVVVIDALRRSALSSQDITKILLCEVMHLSYEGLHDEVIQKCMDGLILCNSAGDKLHAARFENRISTSYWSMGRLSDSISFAQKSVESFDLCLANYSAISHSVELSSLQTERAEIVVNLAVFMDESGKYLEAEQYHIESVGIFLNLEGNQYEKVQVVSNYIINLIEQGKMRDCLAWVKIIDDLNEVYGNSIGLSNYSAYSSTGDVFFALTNFPQGELRYKKMLSLGSETDYHLLPIALIKNAMILFTYGEFDDARIMLEKIEAHRELAHTFGLSLEYRRLDILFNMNEPYHVAQQVLEEAILNTDLDARKKLAQLVLGQVYPPEQAKPLYEMLIKDARKSGRNNLLIGAHARLAATLIDLNQARKALNHTQQALNLMQMYASDVPPWEVHWTHYRVLQALHQPAAVEQLRTCWQLLEDTAQKNVPQEYRQGFLRHSRVTRAILHAVQETGIIKRPAKSTVA